MSSGDSDKTVFKSPFGQGADSTIVPTPGGRGRGAVPQSNQQPIPSGSTDSAQMNSEAFYFQISQGLNPLVNAATSLITVFEKTRSSLSHPDINALYQLLVNEIRSFDSRLSSLGVAPEIALSARYIMCTVLDETILNTPWGGASNWGQRTLLSLFHNESAGGEKFFLILDKIRQSPAANIDLIELIYICISLGFEGKYRLDTNGKAQIELIRDELFTIIRQYRGEYERSLSDSWKGLGQSANALTTYFPTWVIVVVALSFLAVSYSGFRWWLYQSSSPVVSQLELIIDKAETDIKKQESD